ncbi:hypothetical protein [Dactylosporangium sp. CA-092794]|uniref:hypothetical protein n=1 Tax=Dactylosporangium sp. CA-092794 TaxID=3239929 RepID=UPI003D8E7806
MVGSSSMTAAGGARGGMLRALVAQRAFRQLSADDRRVLIELYYRGRSVSEVARTLKITEKALELRAYHAMHALHAAIGSARSQLDEAG